jgi:uncharacterized protein YpmB
MDAQRRQGRITIGLTIMIAASTAIYTWAAVKQVQQAERAAAAMVAPPK